MKRNSTTLDCPITLCLPDTLTVLFRVAVGPVTVSSEFGCAARARSVQPIGRTAATTLVARTAENQRCTVRKRQRDRAILQRKTVASAVS